jgi:glycosyltransferase involved in cell wall biosynthesis
MKILWICPFFLHPTDRGAQIRTLGTLKELHKRHEVHFAALNDPANTEGPRRSSEYSTRHFSVDHAAPLRGSLAIVPQLAGSLLSSVPLAVSRYHSSKLERMVRDLIASEKYDSIVCDFLAAAPSVTNMGQAILFQHNVETTIWQRHAAQTQSFPKKLFFQMQASKMEAYERKICRQAKHVIAVSEIDATRMESMFGIHSVTSVPTGTDVEYFAQRDVAGHASDIMFCGSMDWLPNVDAVVHFVSEILPLIRQQLPGTTFTIAGRSPDAKVLKAVEGLEGVTVTGKVDDMRPYLWGSKISVVPIRIGGGTRLKIYECMAAGLPVVSTTVGAEGLTYDNGRDIAIADDPHDFAAACVRLLSDDAARRSIADAALERAETKLSWEAVSREFEAILESNRLLS